MTCTEQTWLGAYVLDALEPEETVDVRAHVAGCLSCQDEVVRLAWLPALLRTVRLEDVEQLDTAAAHPDPAPPALDRLLAALRSGTPDRLRRTRAALVGLAAVSTIATLGIAATGGDGLGGVPSRPAGVVRTVDPSTGVHAAVTLAARAWGTELHLRLSWVPPGRRCSLVARARDGHADVAASWVATYRGTADVPGTTAIPIDQLAELDVVTADGRQLARLVVPHDGH